MLTIIIKSCTVQHDFMTIIVSVSNSFILRDKRTFSITSHLLSKVYRIENYSKKNSCIHN
jgi:hypothetical protein